MKNEGETESRVLGSAARKEEPTQMRVHRTHARWRGVRGLQKQGPTVLEEGWGGWMDTVGGARNSRKTVGQLQQKELSKNPVAASRKITK